MCVQTRPFEFTSAYVEYRVMHFVGLLSLEIETSFTRKREFHNGDDMTSKAPDYSELFFYEVLFSMCPLLHCGSLDSWLKLDVQET